MRSTDPAAAALLTELREQACLSPEQLARAIFLGGHGYVSGRTVRNVEKDHVIPTLRVRGAIAAYFERTPRDIWRNAPVFHDRRNRVAA